MHVGNHRFSEEPRRLPVLPATPFRPPLSVPTRIMGIANIFEAPTTAERPYERGKTLSESLEIMGRMSANGHIDPDLFAPCVNKGVYLDHARQYMATEQFDEVDHASVLGRLM